MERLTRGGIGAGLDDGEAIGKDERACWERDRGLSELAGRVTLDAMFATPLNKILVGLNSPPPVNLVDYDGLEYKWGIFVFRPARPYFKLVTFAG